MEALAAGPAPARSALLAQAQSALHDLQQQHPGPPSSIAPLSDADLQGFLSAQRSPRASTSARMTSARAAAHEQVKAVGSGYDLPLGLAPFLKEVWLPMVSALSMRFGVGSAEWKRSMELLQRLFGECRWLGGGETELVGTILDDVSGEMSQMGVPANLIQRAQTLLREGLSNEAQVTQHLDLETFGVRAKADRGKNPAPKPQAAAPADSVVDWRAALPVGSWFRVHDRATDRTLWMAADVFYPESPTLSFNGFDPQVRLHVEKGDFLDDLRAGKAEAVNPAPAQLQAIARLVAPPPAAP